MTLMENREQELNKLGIRSIHVLRDSIPILGYQIRLKRYYYPHLSPGSRIPAQIYAEKHNNYVTKRATHPFLFPEHDLNQLTPLYFFSNADRIFRTTGMAAIRRPLLESGVDINPNSSEIFYIGQTLGQSRFKNHDAIQKLTDPIYDGKEKQIWFAQIWISLAIAPTSIITVPIEWLSEEQTVIDIVDFLESFLIYWFKQKLNEPLKNNHYINSLKSAYASFTNVRTLAHVQNGIMFYNEWSMPIPRDRDTFKFQNLNITLTDIRSVIS
ncbi:hypothetical protein [Paenibacillus sp. YAF4_2]|uniref:hypothetical protein n=1 Tax=Paenibacillus sp. YAF4_2 TaxID=3233085 RepID=UPI003F9822C7